MDRQHDLNAYLDGRQSPAQREAFEHQMTGDPALAAAVTEAKRVRALLHALPVDSPPASLAASIMREVRGAAAPRRRPVTDWLAGWARPQRLALATAAAAVMVGVGWFTQAGAGAPPQLSTTDQVFVQECLRDYHLEMSSRCARSSAASATQLTPAALEF